MHIFKKINNQVIFPPRIRTRTRFLPVEARYCLAHAQTRYGADRVPGHYRGPLTVISALHIFLTNTSGFIDTSIVFWKTSRRIFICIFTFIFSSRATQLEVCFLCSFILSVGYRATSLLIYQANHCYPLTTLNINV